MAGFLDSLWEIVFPTPRICPLCQKKQSKLCICSDCMKKLAKYNQEHKHCERCGSFGVSENNCQNHRLWPEYLVSNKSLWPYQDEYRRVILDFKFHRQPWLAELLAELLVPLADSEGEIVIPVPISKERLNERGFNQSALLAENIAKQLNIPYAVDVLLKTKNTPRQSSLRYYERQKSLEGALSISKPEKIIGKKIILVDDVCTSGATLMACAKILHEYSQNEIYALTVCGGVC